MWKKLFSRRKKEDKWVNIIRDKDPNETWDILTELGDGAFGKVFKVRLRVNILFKVFYLKLKNKM